MTKKGSVSEVFNVKYYSIKQVTMEALSLLNQLESNKPNEAIKSGFDELDQEISGWSNGNLILFSSRKGMGSKDLMLEFVRNASVEYNKKAALFTIEKSKEEVVHKLICNETGIDLWMKKPSPFTRENIGDLEEAISQIGNAPIFFVDQPNITLKEIERSCTKLKSKESVSIVFIDSLGNIKKSKKVKNDAWYEHATKRLTRAERKGRS